VDNASEDGSVQEVRDRFPRVRIILNGGNAGLAKANNRAMRESDSEFIILMNNDTIIKPGCFDNLHQFIKTRPDAGIVGARMYYGNGALQMSCFRFPTIANAIYETLGLTSLFPGSRIFGGYEMTWWDHDDPKRVDWVSTACYIARRDVFREVGYIDETYFVYTDDVDMGYKMKQAGYNVYYLPSAELVHLSGRNVTKVSDRKVMESTASLRYTIKKNHGYLYYQTWKSIKILGTLLKILKWRIIGFSGDELRRENARLNTETFKISLRYFLRPLRKIHFSTIQ
jgi:GT2 family glycosyltransferase